MGEPPSFDDRGLKLLPAGWIVGLVGVSLAVLLCIGWPAHLLTATAFAMAMTGMSMHWREFLREDRERRERRNGNRG